MASRPPTETRGLGFLVAEVSRLMRRQFDHRARRLGLTRAQWLFISRLAREPGCTQNELAERLQLEKITVSRHAVRLEAAGWITRRAHDQDARAYRLWPTERALRMNERLAVLAAELREEYLVGIPDLRRQSLMDDLQLIRNNLLALDGPPAA